MAIHYLDLGITAPPASVGPYAMTKFPNDPRANGGIVTSVSAGLLGTVSFDFDATHTEVGVGWSTWSHGFLGDVYYNLSKITIVITPPAGCGAFYFYGEPDVFSTLLCKATEIASGVTSGTIPVGGTSGAHGFAFYADLGGSVGPIRLDWGSPASGAGAIAEFGVGIGIGPGTRPSTLQLFAPTVVPPVTNTALPRISPVGQLFLPSVQLPSLGVCIAGGFPIDEVPGWNDPGGGGPINPPPDLCAMPTGTIMVFGWGDAGTARYLSPNGATSYPQPPSPPTPGSGVSSCCRLSTGDIALVGGGGSDIPDADFPTSGAGVYAGCNLAKLSEADVRIQDGRSCAADALGHWYVMYPTRTDDPGAPTRVLISRLTPASVVVASWDIELPPAYNGYASFPGARYLAVSGDGQTLYSWAYKLVPMGDFNLVQHIVHKFSLVGAGTCLGPLMADWDGHPSGQSLLVVPGSSDLLVAFDRLNDTVTGDETGAIRRYTASGALVWEAGTPAGPGPFYWEYLAPGVPGDPHFLAWAYTSDDTYSEARYVWFDYATGTPDNTRNFTPEDGDFEFDSQIVILAGQPPARGILPRRRST